MIDREKVIESLLQNMHAMRHKFMVGYSEKEKKEQVITPSQGFVLRLVARDGDVNIKAIAERLHITSSAATQLVDGLVDKGYLNRKGGTDDRRMINLSLSDKAKKLFEDFRSQSLHRMMTVFDVLTDDELVQYTALNKKIVDGLGGSKC